MRKWVTNNKELKERIKKHEALYTPVSENANVLEDPNHEQPDTKVLGIGWNLITDSLKLDFEKIVRDTSITMVTKRSILCTTAKFYDPLGLISPVILPLKCLFQELCKIKENWDSPVHDKIAQKFRDIILDIRSVSKIELPRSVMHEVEVSDIKSVQLHGFSDASTVAYAASVYLRVETSSRVVSHLIASKTRVSPLKSESVPRLELMGALILARLMKTVSDALSATLNIDQTFCWSDSQIVIWWIFGENKTFKQLLDRTSCGEEETGSEVLKLSKRSRYLASVIDKFRKSWKREYLTSLREFHNCGKQTTLGINIGDIVYVHESKLPRQRWRMAKVTKLLPGKDGVVRAVELLTSNSAKKHITIKRPIQKLYPIEIRSSSEVTEQDSEEPQITIVRDQDVPEIIVNKTC
eukprot:gene5097-214_t